MSAPRVRPPIFARQGWYPEGEQACRAALEGYRRSFPGAPTGSLAGVVPHAGWVYSGRLAAWTFAALSAAAPGVVFVFGGHLGPGDPGACMPEGAFGTPLGPVEVEPELAEALVRRFGLARETPEEFEPDNTLELQMPILKATWPAARVVAIQAPPGPVALELGRAAAEEAGRRGLDCLAIGSTDLTHYGRNYGFTPQGSGAGALRWSKEENDRPFLEHLLAGRPAEATAHALAHRSACCPGAAAAAVSFALARGATRGALLEHTTSHEVEGRGGEPRMWVGYAGLVF
ncbi:MAG TPA: AmmeMemoRadiSam system protein B [Myxococcota bacterium]|nr:AmmeMemoRadiSam system protein B [Myxococcota bacterium]HRY93013.1 AmmeMemoRadiSam system protein B [Myxococcota bacterium]HSA20254.1 AmmeMemoRadiSam system protein B [Myxococcota bacterium]